MVRSRWITVIAGALALLSVSTFAAARIRRRTATGGPV